MIALKFFGRVSDRGNLVLADVEGFKNHLVRYAGTEIDLIVKKASKDKTQAQLGYFFGVLVPAMCEVTGYDDEEMYGICKKRFLTRNPDTTKEYVASLSQLNREEVARFIDDCIGLATFLGADIPPPNRVLTEGD